jgi:hypothetical protein
MEQWKALSARVTVFPTVGQAAAPPPLALEFYRNIWQLDPDFFQKQSNLLAPTLAQGTRDGISIQCISHPSRVDFNLAPSPLPDSALATLPVSFINDAGQLENELRRIINALERISVDANRVALGLQFAVSKPTVAECNKILLTVIPSEYQIKVGSEEDFIFQINVPRHSAKVPTWRMNCVRKWSVDQVQVMAALGMDMSSGLVNLPFPNTRKTHLVANVSFDNNNAPVSSAVLRANEQSLFLEEALDVIRSSQRDIGLNIQGF